MSRSKQIAEFQNELLRNMEIRDFPWRYESDAYAVLVSEFMLHRTKATQVIPIYVNFLEKYPSLNIFIQATWDEVYEDVKSLGLNWRIEAMYNALHEIWEQYGEIPVDYAKLLSIRGIGQYIAGAVICFTQNHPITLIDTNVVRVVGRYWGLSLKGEARRRKEMIDTITLVSSNDNPRDFYYAIIDLAHTICVPRKPQCHLCFLKDSCRETQNLRS